MMASVADVDAELPRTSTTGLQPAAGDRRPTVARRGFLVALGLVVAAGGVGLLGVRSSRTTATEGPWNLSLSYPSLARPGQDIAWLLTVHRDGGLPDPVQLAVTGDYFSMYNSGAFQPVPSDQSSDGGTWRLTLTTPPQADNMTLSYQGSVQPSSWVGGTGTVAIIEGERPRAAVTFRTRLVP